MQRSGELLLLSRRGGWRAIRSLIHHLLPHARLQLTQLPHAGGKLGGQGNGYSICNGLHSMGISVVNALSKQLHATVW